MEPTVLYDMQSSAGCGNNYIQPCYKRASISDPASVTTAIGHKYHRVSLEATHF